MALRRTLLTTASHAALTLLAAGPLTGIALAPALAADIVVQAGETKTYNAPLDLGPDGTLVNDGTIKFPEPLPGILLERSESAGGGTIVNRGTIVSERELVFGDPGNYGLFFNYSDGADPDEAVVRVENLGASARIEAGNVAILSFASVYLVNEGQIVSRDSSGMSIAGRSVVENRYGAVISGSSSGISADYLELRNNGKISGGNGSYGVDVNALLLNNTGIIEEGIETAKFIEGSTNNGIIKSDGRPVAVEMFSGSFLNSSARYC